MLAGRKNDRDRDACIRHERVSGYCFFHHLILEKTNKKRAMPPLTKPSIHVKMRETLSERQGQNVKLEDKK